MSSDSNYTMEINTYTDVWRGKKRLYALEDIKLPAPAPLVSIGTFVATALLWMPILYTLGVPFTTPFGLILYVSLPAALAVVANKEIFEKKSLMDFLVSQSRFLFQSKQYDDARPVPFEKNIEKEVAANVWVSMADTYPPSRKPPKKAKKQKRA